MAPEIARPFVVPSGVEYFTSITAKEMSNYTVLRFTFATPHQWRKLRNQGIYILEGDLYFNITQEVRE